MPRFGYSAVGWTFTGARSRRITSLSETIREALTFATSSLVKLSEHFFQPRLSSLSLGTCLSIGADSLCEVGHFAVPIRAASGHVPPDRQVVVVRGDLLIGDESRPTVLLRLAALVGRDNALHRV